MTEHLEDEYDELAKKREGEGRVRAEESSCDRPGVESMMQCVKDMKVMELRGVIWPQPLTCESQGDRNTQGREKPETLGSPAFWAGKRRSPQKRFRLWKTMRCDSISPRPQS